MSMCETDSVTNLEKLTRERKYECCKCNNKFVQKSHLKTHQQVHKIPKKQCVLCPLTFIFKNNLDIHFKKVHLGEEIFSCEYCHKEFPTNYKLRSHVEKHIDVKRFECGECHAKFNFRTSLTHHQETVHKNLVEVRRVVSTIGKSEKITERKPCDLCNRMFKFPNGLKRHLKMKHKIQVYSDSEKVVQ